MSSPSPIFEFKGFIAPAVALIEFKKVPDAEKASVDLTEYHGVFKALLLAAREEKHKIAIVVDVTQCNWISLAVLTKKVEFIKELHAENLVSGILAGSAIVIENRLFSWVLEYVFKMVKPQSPANSFFTQEDAIKWCGSLV